MPDCIIEFTCDCPQEKGDSVKQEQKQKGKRKTRWGRILLLFGCTALLAAGIGWGSGKFAAWQEQEQYKTQLESRMDRARTVLDLAENASYERNMDAESFSAIISYAREDLKGYISALQKAEEGTITPEAFQEAMDLPDPSADYQRILSNLQYYSQEQASLFMQDKDRLEYMAHFPSQESYMNPPASLSANFSSIPYIYQWDPTWAYLPFQDSSIALAGSRLVTLSMALSWLKKDASLTPWAIAQILDAPLSEEEQMYLGYADLEGRTQDLFASYGIEAQELAPDEASIASALENGSLILARREDGLADHWILAVRTGDGAIRVLDAESKKDSQNPWSLEDLLNTCSRFIALQA